MSESSYGTSDDPDASDAARQEGERMKGTAKDAASNVGDTATQRGQEVKRQATEHARSITRDATKQVRSRADQETQRAGAALGNAGSQLQALADGNIDEAGAFGEYVRQAADSVNRWADTVQNRGLDGLLDDMRDIGRRRPGMFLGGALIAGVLVGRFGRNVAPELTEGDDNPLPKPVTEASTSSDDSSESSNTFASSDSSDFDTSSEFGRAPELNTPRTSGRVTTADERDDDLIVGHASEDRDLDFEPIDVRRGDS